jgi:hypothetical protein
MTDEELDLRRIAARADRARAIIEDELLVAAFANLEATYVEAWQATRSDDTAGREALWHRIKALGMVRADLNRVLEDGMIARDRLDDISAGITNP